MREAGILAVYERPSPYVGTYCCCACTTRPTAGRELVPAYTTGWPTRRRLRDTSQGTSVTVAFTWDGLQALGAAGVTRQLRTRVPGESRNRRRRSATSGRAPRSSGRSRSAPATCWSPSPFCRLTRPELDTVTGPAAYAELPGVELLWRQDYYQLATGDVVRTEGGSGQPPWKETDGLPPTTGTGRSPAMILGYPDETGELPPMRLRRCWVATAPMWCPQAAHQQVAAYRSYLPEAGNNAGEASARG